MLAWKEIRRRRCPYAVEVTGDPWAGLAPGTMKTWFRPIGRRLYTQNLVRQCRHATAVSYVTQGALQQRYPAAPGAFTTNYSSVDMPPECYVDRPRTFSPGPRELVHVGSLQHFYKAPDILVRALAACAHRGLQFRLKILGDGQRRGDLEDLIRSVGIEDRVELLGHVADRRIVLEQLDEADLFVLPSRMEGLPRAMIEAMGRALPCIGSTAGGMPELLPGEDLVPPGDADALRDKIIEVLGDPERMSNMSARNLRVASDYRSDVLAPRRRAMYMHLRAVSTDAM